MWWRLACNAGHQIRDSFCCSIHNFQLWMVKLAEIVIKAEYTTSKLVSLHLQRDFWGFEQSDQMRAGTIFFQILQLIYNTTYFFTIV